MAIRNFDEFINEISFGNPSYEDFQLMQVTNYLDKLLPELQKFTPPTNSSRGTKEELNMLIEYSVADEKNSRKHVFDSALVPYIQDLFIRNGAVKDDILKVTQQIVDDICPLITKLKFQFNRPRPFQLAYYYKFKLFPRHSYFVSSPSYPSGHTTIAAVMCETLGNLYPESYEAMLRFTKEVSESRLYMGVHYPSDNNLSMMIAERVLNNPEFKIKYQL